MKRLSALGLLVALMLVIGVMSRWPAYAANDGFLPITTSNAADLRPLMISTKYTTGLYFSADSTALIEAGDFITPEILNLVSGKKTVLPPDSAVLAITADRSMLLLDGSNSSPGTSLYDTRTGSTRVLFGENTRSGVFSPDGMLVVTVASDGLTRLWNVQTGQTLFSFSTAQHKYTFEQFSPDSRYMVTLRDDGLTFLLAISGDEYLQLNSFPYVTFTPDGSKAVTSNGAQFALWDAASWTQFASYDTGGDFGIPDSIVVSPDGGTILFYNSDFSPFGVPTSLGGAAYLWDISDPSHAVSVATLDTVQGDQFAFDPAGTTLAIFNNGYYSNKGIRLMDTSNGELRTTAKDQPGAIRQVAFSADGNLLISAGTDKTVHVRSWDGNKATLLATLVGDDFVLSPDETTLVTQLRGSVTLVYGVPTAQRPVQPLPFPATIVPSSVNVRAEPSSSAAIVGQVSGDVIVSARDEKGDYVYIPDAKGWVRSNSAYISLYNDLPVDIFPVFDTAQMVALSVTPTPAPVTPAPTLAPSAAPPTAQFTPTVTLTPTPVPLQIEPATIELPAPPDGFQPITSANLGQISLLGVLPTGMVSFQNYPPATVASDGSRLLTISRTNENDTAFELWDLVHQTLLRHQDLDTFDYAVNHDASLFAYKSGSSIHVVDAATGTERVALPFSEYARIGSMTFSHDNQLLATSGYGDDLPHIWDLESGQSRTILPSNGGLAFSPDDSLLAVYSGYGTIRLYDTTTGELKTTIDVPNAYFQGFSPDGSVVATFDELALQFWSVTTGELSGAFELKEHFPQRFILSSDWHYVAVISRENDPLQVWDIRSGTMSADLPVDSDTSMAFSQDAALLATNKPLQVVDIASRTVQSLAGDYNGDRILFSPDNATLFLGDGLSTLIFGVPTETRPVWQPITGHIKSSGINLRSTPNPYSDIIGYASGDVLIGGRNDDGSAVYLPELKGWIRSAEQYLDLGDHTVADLPQIVLPND